CTQRRRRRTGEPQAGRTCEGEVVDEYRRDFRRIHQRAGGPVECGWRAGPGNTQNETPRGPCGLAKQDREKDEKTMKTTRSFYRRLLTHRAVLGVMGVLALLVAGCATDVNRL